MPGHTREYIHYLEAARDVPAYAELERLIRERAFDVLICRGRDRLGRTDALIATAEAIIASGGAQVLSMAMPHPITDKADRGQLYVAAIERAGAQVELIELRRRHQSGMRGRTLRGGHRGSCRPRGFAGMKVDLSFLRNAWPWPMACTSVGRGQAVVGTSREDLQRGAHSCSLRSALLDSYAAQANAQEPLQP